MSAAWAPSEREMLSVLLVGGRGRMVIALPLPHVVEIMRPLPRESVGDMPSFVSGLSIIRGKPVPVVDLDDLLDQGAAGRPATRFVVVRVDNRRVALAVEDVIGLRAIDASSHEQMPPLLRNARSDVVDAVGVLDGELLVMLRSARIVPEDVWDKWPGREARP